MPASQELLRPVQLQLLQRLRGELTSVDGVRTHDLPIELLIGVSKLVELQLVEYGWADDGSSMNKLTDAGRQRPA